MEKYPKMKKIPKAGWTKFGFPLNYNSDVLDALRSLKSINFKNCEEINPSLELIRKKNVEGKWIKETQYKSPFYSEIEEHKKPSKWLTFHALDVLNHFEGLIFS